MRGLYYLAIIFEATIKVTTVCIMILGDLTVCSSAVNLLLKNCTSNIVYVFVAIRPTLHFSFYGSKKTLSFETYVQNKHCYV